MPIKFGLRQFLNPVFVETGLYRGDGTRKALRAGFKKIYSIEIDRKWIRRARAQMPGHIFSGRLVLIHGGSAERMHEVTAMIDTPATFWLDAHFGGKRNPLISELETILAHPRNDHTILIDDLRMFEKWHVDRDRVEQLLLERQLVVDVDVVEGSGLAP